ncbi:hypothetical protein Tco_0752292 [Tanacetum coccineum]|uniref:Secreted protein n=1 Tax=Tanacetum coccineum TaxID=301880 RepID=A0ABQ4Z833_9ASTR
MKKALRLVLCYGSVHGTMDEGMDDFGAGAPLSLSPSLSFSTTRRWNRLVCYDNIAGNRASFSENHLLLRSRDSL